MVPQKLIRTIALKTLEPPVFATMIPNRIKKNKVEIYREYFKCGKGRNSTTTKGNAPPETKDKQLEIAA